MLFKGITTVKPIYLAILNFFIISILLSSCNSKSSDGQLQFQICDSPAKIEYESSNVALPYVLLICGNGESICDPSGLYVLGGYFRTLKDCNGAIKHQQYYGSKVGGNCLSVMEQPIRYRYQYLHKCRDAIK